jgi:hypothetical protein
MNANDSEIPDEINAHKKNWGKNADQVVYGGGERDNDDDEYRCPFCRSRIDEYGYCACGGNLGVD